ncbi:MAG: DUF433 domain-containing protein [Kiloniellales bacterium]|nr:DUF433 domain-containing protein [Kiloniellales bacterium]
MAHERITADPAILMGKPVIKGTRISVEQILRELGHGLTPEAIVHEHPHLSLEDVRAAQAFAADHLSDEEVVFR